MESKNDKPIPDLVRPLAALLLLGISLVGIGVGVFGVLMGVFWGFPGPLLFGTVLNNLDPAYANLVMMVIAAFVAGSFGLFLGLRVLQTGRLDADVLIPFKKRR